MIDDIVALPRRLVHATDTKVSSEACYSRPISCISRLTGYEPTHDEDWSMYGGAFTLPNGEDALFRYKLIECTPKSILEFFCLSESPIDIANPFRSKRTKLYCLWVTCYDIKSMRIRKYVLWRSIRELIRFEVEDNVVDAPIEAVIAAEIRTFAKMYGDIELWKEVENYPDNRDDVLISELQFDPDTHVDQLQMLKSNIAAYNEQYDASQIFSPLCPMDIFRGLNLPKVWTDLTPIRCSSILPFVQFGSITLDELLHLLSPMYKLHNFHRHYQNQDLGSFVRTDLPADDYGELFRIIKYTEALPYSEFVLRIERNGKDEFELKTLDEKCPSNKPIIEESKIITKPVIQSIRLALETGFPDYIRATLQKSWEDEIYITITNGGKDVSELKFFYDLSSASICSRSLMRDCDSTMFSLGF